MKAFKGKLKFILPVVLIVVIAGVYFLFIRKQEKELFYSGVIEATTYDLAFGVPGKAQEFYYDEGKWVEKGDLVARLEPETFEAQLKQARAKLGKAEANLDDLLAGPRPEEIRQAREKLYAAKADLRMLENGPTENELEMARSSMQASYQNYLLTESGFREEDVLSAKSAMESAESNLETARKDYERYKNLIEMGAVARQKFDMQENRYESALAGYEAARQNYMKLERGFRPEEKRASYEQYSAQRAQYEKLADGTRQELIDKARANVNYWENQVEILLQGPRKDTVKAAQQQVEEAEAAVEMAEENYKNSKLYAPAGGVIITKNFEPGETVGGGAPAVTLADIETPWVYIFVPEPDLGKINLNDEAEIITDSFPGKKFKGRVARIYEKAEYTPKFIQTEKLRVNLVFRVKVEAENPGNVLKPGMPADVKIVKK